jgi:hypothetical protein
MNLDMASSPCVVSRPVAEDLDAMPSGSGAASTASASVKAFRSASGSTLLGGARAAGAFLEAIGTTLSDWLSF